MQMKYSKSAQNYASSDIKHDRVFLGEEFEKILKTLKNTIFDQKNYETQKIIKIDYILFLP